MLHKLSLRPQSLHQFRKHHRELKEFRIGGVVFAFEAVGFAAGGVPQEEGGGDIVARSGGTEEGDVFELLVGGGGGGEGLCGDGCRFGDGDAVEDESEGVVGGGVDEVADFGVALVGRGGQSMVRRRGFVRGVECGV